MPIQEEEIDGVIQKIEEASVRLARLVEVDPVLLSRSYGEGKWNGHQLVAHLADSAAVHYYRFLKTIAEAGSPLVPFDQDKWAAELHYEERPLSVSLAVIEANFAAVTYQLETLPSEVLERAAFHPEFGELTVFKIAATMAGHTLHHLEQIDAIVAGRDWERRV